MSAKDTEREGRSFLDGHDAVKVGSLVFVHDEFVVFEKGLFVVNSIAQNVWAAVEASSNYQKFGTIYLKAPTGSEQIITELYRCEGDRCAIIRNIGNVPQPLLQEWADYVLLSGIKELVIFEGMHIAKYNHSLNSRIRVMFTSTLSEENRATHSSLTELEVGNILDGCAAAIFCKAELLALNATLYIVVREASYTLEAARSLESLAPFISSFLGDREVVFPGLIFHRNMLKSDGFMYTTENMFT
jgi:hypothetical protein